MGSNPAGSGSIERAVGIPGIEPAYTVTVLYTRAGVREEVVGGFEALYSQLRRRFRYGLVDGSEWQAANGAVQGCPASPDLLNLLLEAFHRWARAAGYGVRFSSTTSPSMSYTDDVALIAGSEAEMQDLI